MVFIEYLYFQSTRVLRISIYILYFIYIIHIYTHLILFLKITYIYEKENFISFVSKYITSYNNINKFSLCEFSQKL